MAEYRNILAFIDDYEKIRIWAFRKRMHINEMLHQLVAEHDDTREKYIQDEHSRKNQSRSSKKNREDI
jgi:hypothetical protein